MMIMTRSRNCSCNPSRGGSHVRSGASPVRLVLLLFAAVVLLFAVVVMMMIGLLLLLFLFASRVVGCRRHPLLLSPIRSPW